MKTTFNETELKEKAINVFAHFPHTDKVFATVDGNIFTMKNRAELHAGANGRVIMIDRPVDTPSLKVVEDTNKKEKVYADDLIEAIGKVDSLEQLEETFSNDKRKTVIEAYEFKKSELIANTAPIIEEDTHTESKGLTKDGKSPENHDNTKTK